ncbi:hypothetical protein COU17_01425 [Candidatus Kaiserbacteria bacterium CG10_big_fil_rev_8_21_14_0_10_49_17]|uniref:Nudix hydrolase domain-containing protein n=1 Tax=Candidatus Kaiserbacteria bacterium CG10_big_fil_rev_8_21_14_0_10_49_17 TaxID=1974609 RepID=A0A2M6WEP7_9BACT|nr:MAG: hypothetical protein COU17_01425 [Candidatus Kaiserbacteria bacterium CG10_big_fil_rev_8_21_14_0_10_49_17]
MARQINLAHAEADKLFYFVTTIVVYRESDQKCLILKRAGDDAVLPGKWGLPGGRLEWSHFDLEHPDEVDGEILNFNGPVEAHVKELLEEKAGLSIGERPQYLGSVFFVRGDGTPSILVRFAARIGGGEAEAGGGFTDSAWVDAEEITQYDHVEGIDKEILKAIKLFS